MLQDWLKLPPGERKPVHLKDNISMVVYDSSSGLLFVAYTLENMQPLQIIEALKAITMCLHSAFGGRSEEKVCCFHAPTHLYLARFFVCPLNPQGQDGLECCSVVVQVRGNLHMVSEIVSECVDYGIVTQLQLHVVLDRIHSRYLAPKRSLLQIMRTAGYRSGQFRCRTPA